MLASQAKHARDITLRMLCVGALVFRRELELRYLAEGALERTPPRDYLARTLASLYEWLEAEKLGCCLTETEQRLIHQPLGAWSQRALHGVGWRTETLGMLLWTLRLIDAMPAFDTRFAFAELARAVDILTPTIDLLWCAELRTPAQLTRMRDTTELWDWRCRAAELFKLGVRPSHGVNYEDVIRVTAEQAHADGTLPAPLEGDFPAFGRPFARLSPEQYHTVRAISAERYSAICWVTELNAEWESLPIDL